MNSRVEVCRVFLLGLIFAFAACATEEEVVAPPVSPIDYGSISNIRFSDHVRPLMVRSCARSGCHESGTRAAGLDLSSWTAMIRGSTFGEALVPFSPERSLLVSLFDGTPQRKPHPALGAQGLADVELNFLKRWIREGARDDSGVVPSVPTGRRLYVPNQGDDMVAIIDVDNLIVSRYVNVGSSPASDAPHFVVADDNYWYVSLIGAGQVWKFDARTDTLVGVTSISGSPALLELTADGSKLYVSQFMTASTNRVNVINTATMSVIRSIPVWTMPHGIRLNRAGTRLYVANMMSDNISVIDVATDSVIAMTMVAHDASPFGPVRYMPVELAVSPDDAFVLVTCSERQEVRMFDAVTMALIDSFRVGDQPWHLQFSPDGLYCYVANRRGNTVSIIHMPMRHVMETVTAPATFSYPHGCDVSRDGRYTFISSENIGHTFTPRYAMEFVGNVAVIDNVTLQIVKTLEVGRMPTGISITR